MDGTDRLAKTTDRLDQGYQIAQETEEIGLEIMDNLHRDRETIQRMRGRVSHMMMPCCNSLKLLSLFIASGDRC